MGNSSTGCQVCHGPCSFLLRLEIALKIKGYTKLKKKEIDLYYFALSCVETALDLDIRVPNAEVVLIGIDGNKSSSKNFIF